MSLGNWIYENAYTFRTSIGLYDGAPPCSHVRLYYTFPLLPNRSSSPSHLLSSFLLVLLAYPPLLPGLLHLHKREAKLIPLNAHLSHVRAANKRSSILLRMRGVLRRNGDSGIKRVERNRERVRFGT